MSGLPAAGKDTWLRHNANDRPIIALDALREDLGIDPAGDQSGVIAAAKEQARLHLRKGEPFIWNATNTSRFLRDSLISFFLSYRAQVEIVYCEAPFPQMQERNARRHTPVPTAVIDRLLTKLEISDLTEAHTVTYRVW